jgi:IclR family acetate operon transcriptional repressor
VEEARRNGFAIDEGNFGTGITTVAAVVPNQNGNPMMAISIIGLTTQFAEIDMQALTEAVKSAAREISAAMGGAKPAA